MGAKVAVIVFLPWIAHTEGARVAPRLEVLLCSTPTLGTRSMTRRHTSRGQVTRT